MLSTSPEVESRESFRGSAGVSKALLELRDGEGSLWGPPEEAWGGIMEI